MGVAEAVLLIREHALPVRLVTRILTDLVRRAVLAIQTPTDLAHRVALATPIPTVLVRRAVLVIPIHNTEINR